MILNGIFIINLQPAFLKARHPPHSSHKFNRSAAIFSNSILLPDAVTPRCHTGWRLQSHNSSFGCDRHSDLAYSIVNIVLSEPPLSDSLTQRAFHFRRPHFHPFPAFFERGPAVWKKKKMTGLRFFFAFTVIYVYILWRVFRVCGWRWRFRARICASMWECFCGGEVRRSVCVCV